MRKARHYYNQALWAIDDGEGTKGWYFLENALKLLLESAGWTPRINSSAFLSKNIIRKANILLKCTRIRDCFLCSGNWHRSMKIFLMKSL
ncbi:MAG: hypothetical protein U5N56_01150 [Candidatus Marinimicrobia bacterium]|nr:hypothetical protein [Candidatus Neomarinimicrobiota bacterium]